MKEGFLALVVLLVARYVWDCWIERHLDADGDYQDMGW
jgi:hypothetical protein